MQPILIISDSATDALLISQQLENHGFSAHWAERANHGQELARSLSPHLVLAIHSPPAVDAVNVTRDATQDPLTAHIPVVVLLPRQHMTLRIRALWEGARDTIRYPTSEAHLIYVVRSFLDWEVRDPKIVSR